MVRLFYPRAVVAGGAGSGLPLAQAGRLPCIVGPYLIHQRWSRVRRGGGAPCCWQARWRAHLESLGVMDSPQKVVYQIVSSGRDPAELFEVLSGLRKAADSPRTEALYIRGLRSFLRRFGNSGEVAGDANLIEVLLEAIGLCRSTESILALVQALLSTKGLELGLQLRCAEAIASVCHRVRNAREATCLSECISRLPDFARAATLKAQADLCLAQAQIMSKVEEQNPAVLPEALRRHSVNFLMWKVRESDSFAFANACTLRGLEYVGTPPCQEVLRVCLEMLMESLFLCRDPLMFASLVDSLKNYPLFLRDDHLQELFLSEWSELYSFPLAYNRAFQKSLARAFEGLTRAPSDYRSGCLEVLYSRAILALAQREPKQSALLLEKILGLSQFQVDSGDGLRLREDYARVFGNLSASIQSLSAAEVRIECLEKLKGFATSEVMQVEAGKYLAQAMLWARNAEDVASARARWQRFPLWPENPRLLQLEQEATAQAGREFRRAEALGPQGLRLGDPANPHWKVEMSQAQIDADGCSLFYSPQDSWEVGVISFSGRVARYSIGGEVRHEVKLDTLSGIDFVQTSSSTDWDTTFSYSILFQAPGGTLLRLEESERFGEWDRALPLAASGIYELACVLARGFGVSCRQAGA